MSIELIKKKVNFFLTKYPNISESALSQSLGYSRNYLNTILKVGLKSDEALERLSDVLANEFSVDDDQEFMAILHSDLMQEHEARCRLRLDNLSLARLADRLEESNADLKQEVAELQDYKEILKNCINRKEDALQKALNDYKVARSEVADLMNNNGLLQFQGESLSDQLNETRGSLIELEGRYSKKAYMLSLCILFLVAMTASTIFLWSMG